MSYYTIQAHNQQRTSHHEVNYLHLKPSHTPLGNECMASCMDCEPVYWLNQRGVSFWSRQTACGITPVSIWQRLAMALAQLWAACCVWHDIGQWMERARIPHLSLWKSSLHHHRRASLPIHYHNVHCTTWVSSHRRGCQGSALPEFDWQRLDKEEFGVRPPLWPWSQESNWRHPAGKRLRMGSREKWTASSRNGTSSSHTGWCEIQHVAYQDISNAWQPVEIYF